MALVVSGAAAVAFFAYLFLHIVSPRPQHKPSELAARIKSNGLAERKSAHDVGPTTTASNQELHVATQDGNSNELFRINYEKSPDLPNGVAFWTLFLRINRFSTTNPSLANTWVRTEMGLSDKDTKAFLAKLQTTYKAYQTELAEVSKNLACSEQNLGANDKELYATLERLDDLTYSLAEKHLRRLKAEVGPETADRMQEALDNSKLRISHSQFRQDVAHETQGLKPEDSIALVCEQLNQSQQRSGAFNRSTQHQLV